MAKPPERLLSLSEVARKLNISYPRALDLRTAGDLAPDFLGPQVILFRPSRIPQLRKEIQL